MNRKIYMVIAIVIAGLFVVGIAITTKKPQRSTYHENEEIEGILVASYNISGDGVKTINIDETWKEVKVYIIYDPSTVGKNPYAILYDCNNNTQYDFGIDYEEGAPGITLKSGTTINLYAPPYVIGPYGTWKVEYHLSENAVANLKIYKIPLEQ